MVFSIPADYASKDVRMRIEYSFAWERDNEMEGGSYSAHSVLFYFSYLPKSVLPTAGVAGFDWRGVGEIAGCCYCHKQQSRTDCCPNNARLALQSTALEARSRLNSPRLKTVSFAHHAPHGRCLSR